MNRIEVRSKIWLELDGQPFLGGGREALLRRIHQVGSISAAARELGLTYRKAWSFINAMEEKFGSPLLARQPGGNGGGRSTLTAEAIELLERFDRLCEGINQFVDEKFAEVFTRG